MTIRGDPRSPPLHHAQRESRTTRSPRSRLGHQAPAMHSVRATTRQKTMVYPGFCMVNLRGRRQGGCPRAGRKTSNSDAPPSLQDRAGRHRRSMPSGGPGRVCPPTGVDTSCRRQPGADQSRIRPRRHVKRMRCQTTLSVCIHLHRSAPRGGSVRARGDTRSGPHMCRVTAGRCRPMPVDEIGQPGVARPMEREPIGAPRPSPTGSRSVPRPSRRCNPPK